MVLSRFLRVGEKWEKAMRRMGRGGKSNRFHRRNVRMRKSRFLCRNLRIYDIMEIGELEFSEMNSEGKQ